MLSNHLPILQVVIPLIFAPVCVILRNGTLSWVLASLVSCITFIIACLLLTSVSGGNNITYALGGWVAPAGIEYHVDLLTAYMLLIINAVAAVVVIAARESMASEIASDRLYLFYAAFLLNLTGLLGVVMTGDAFNLFVFIEIASLSSYAMISISRDRRCLYAAFKYLILGTIGASFILISVGLLYAVTGTLNIFDLSDRLGNVENTNTVITALIFFTIGIAIKAAIFPLHLWLPDAYTYSPVIVSTFLAGTTTKVFIYALIRFIYSLFGYEFSFNQLVLNDLLMILACGAVLYGSIQAIRQDSIKRLLAYSSIAQIGYMVLGISIATELGLAASLAHVFNHAVIKVALFLSVACIIYRYNTEMISQLHGISKFMPYTSACFLFGGLSLIGIPLTAGFTSKWLLIQASFSAGYWSLVIIIVFSSILSILYVWKVVEAAYFKTPAVELSNNNTQNAPRLLYIALFIFVLANLYFGTETSVNIGFAKDIAYGLVN